MQAGAALAAALACVACQASAEAMWHSGPLELAAREAVCELRYGDPEGPQLSILFDRAIANFEIRARDPSVPPVQATSAPARLDNGQTLISGEAFALADGHGFSIWPTDPMVLHDFLAQGQNAGGTLTLAAGPIRAGMPLDARFAEGWEHFEDCLRQLPR
jgi:hypothetical protein